MHITVPYTYTSSIVPRRCRKARDVRQQATMTLTIHEVTAREAPVAIIAHEADWKQDLGGPTPPVYRLWRNHLYARYFHQEVSRGPWGTQDVQTFSRHYAERESRHSWSDYRSQQEKRSNLRAWASQILFIEGERWQRSGEPRYVVMTFGLGHNHGLGWGTSLSTDTVYNSNIPASRYFRCDQYAEAVAAATAMALKRGDTKALPIAQQEPTQYEILLPEAIRLRPQRQHGPGDVFMNKAESLIEASSDAGVAGLLLMASVAV
jgi:hypothetical protein